MALKVTDVFSSSELRERNRQYVTGSEKTRLKSEVLVVGKKRNSVQRSQNVKICFLTFSTR